GRPFQVARAADQQAQGHADQQRQPQAHQNAPETDPDVFVELGTAEQLVQAEQCGLGREQRGQSFAGAEQADAQPPEAEQHNQTTDAEQAGPRMVFEKANQTLNSSTRSKLFGNPKAWSPPTASMALRTKR